MFSRFPSKDDSGVTGIEYALMAGLIAVVLAVGARTTETSVVGAFVTVISALCPHDINLDVCIRSAESLAPI
jgi:Flp pilus assembly pilin Flp